MTGERKRRATAHLLAALVANCKGQPRRALFHAMLAELEHASDAALTEQALALEQLGKRRQAAQVWSIVRSRNPGMGDWDTVAKAFLDHDEDAISRMERWNERKAERGIKRLPRGSKLAS